MAALILVLIAAVVVVVSAPLRRRDGAGAVGAGTQAGGEAAATRARMAEAHIAELEAAREAKYQEIRDAELDFRTGKLSRGDYEAIDAALRAEAIEVLDRLEAAARGETKPDRGA